MPPTRRTFRKRTRPVVRKRTPARTIRRIVKTTMSRQVDTHQRQIVEDLSSDGTAITTNRTWQHLSGVAPGDWGKPTFLAEGSDERQRQSNRIKLSRLRVNGTVVFPSYISDTASENDLGGQALRVIIVQLRPNATFAEITTLLNTGPHAEGNPYGIGDDIRNSENFRAKAHILYDKVHHRKQDAQAQIASAGTPATGYASIGTYITRYVMDKRKFPLQYLRWKIETGDAEPDLQGAIGVYVMYTDLDFVGAELPAHPVYYPFGFQISYKD